MLTHTETTVIPAFPQASARVQSLLSQMTLEEKAAQIVGYWLDQGGEVVAPMQGEMSGSVPSGALADITRHGIGHFTRVYGTRPVDPAERAAWLWAEQRRLQSETRLGIPALVHEECLTGLAAWKAATFPTPLAWGASFDPALVEEMAVSIGDSMRELGIHQGLAPVLDVIRDPRWGRVDECIAEDPYVVGVLGTAYVKGLQDAGVHATLKHFVGYSGSRAGRNHAPVSAGPREVADVFLPPFEMAVVEGGVRSVMNSYAEIDGVPLGSSAEYLTALLRERWGFDGVVVADYFAVAFLEIMHRIAADRGEAAQAALTAGIDVELPTGDAYLEPLIERVKAGLFDEAYLDRAVLRVLGQKEDLGLLEPGAFADGPPADIDLDSPRHRDIARRLAEESIVLLSNDGVLPLAATASTIAVIGPNADRAEALMGCYSFANHVLAHHPEYPIGFEIPTVAQALTAELPGARVVGARGCEVEGDDRSGFAEAVEAARAADVAIVVVGDQAGLFGRGTVGEGNDSESLELPGVQRELVEELVATGTPVVMIALTGRPYAIGWAIDGENRPAAVMQAFFPGEEGAGALAGVIAGRVNPSGRLPVSLPRSAGAQPYSYLHPRLGGPSDVTATDPTPVRPFGFGLSYASFEYDLLAVDEEVSAGAAFGAVVRVTNTGSMAADHVVQLYGHDVTASVTRPEAQLLGFHRLALAAGESAEIAFTVPTQRFAFSDRSMVRIVEPGDVHVWAGADAATDVTRRATVRITGAAHTLTRADPRLVQAEVVRV
ncbi:Periplasmic beta-glucosidase precursor [Microbacterium hydrocarbonoxydans]|uniref:Periplasmic beta-glucosidase n=1 Tax=Microbacterium hydrocarbonoxydans TaxID=273678 RepID=A0A0M2HT70_9MICO|nr:glycoside hydrolase family 3 N-terminal domain-containing protein [Microbacterium hydrocarbonoxydans]KJL47668.1 Periplasmic beta-glucosidase precursor [Microbacterium hydrocarbonoxydans]